MADSLFGQNVLGSAYLPASPLYPVQDLTAPNPSAAQPGQGAAPPPDPSAGVPAPAAAAGGPPPWVAGLLPSQPGGVFGPNTGRVMSALGAGLSSAGQNWNKPALAAFASGAGAALQGAQQFDNQVQDAKLKALHAAIAAWKVGDMAAYRQATLNLQTLMARQQQRAAAASSAAPPGSAAAPANNPAAPPAGTGSASGRTVYGGPAPSPPTPPAASNGASVARPATQDVIAQARDAIARGAPPQAVKQRLHDHGFDSSGL
jgi:hypothetical protein